MLYTATPKPAATQLPDDVLPALRKVVHGTLPDRVLFALREAVHGKATSPIWVSDGPKVIAFGEVIAEFIGPNAEANADYCATLRAGGILMLEEIERLRKLR